jgi:hypothetical protein
MAKRSKGKGKTQPASLRPALAELERAFLAFAPLFGRELPLPVVTIQHRGRRAALGWFAGDRWQEATAGDRRLPEINICAESLARDTDDIAHTLIHEMVHYVNALDGIRDCSKNQYHNKHFRDRCHSVGLNSEKMGGRGWAQTSLSPGLLALVREVALDAAAFAIFRPEEEQARPGSKMKKWTCGCTIIRAAVEVQALCIKCEKMFALAEPAGAPAGERVAASL